MMANHSEVYEDAARTVLSNLREELGLTKVETKQLLVGHSGTKWEIDARAWCEGSEKFLVVEARRHTTARLKQESVAAVAFRIGDLGAAGGIIVSPLPLQKGAKLVAQSAHISHVRLTADSTPELYLAEYMGRRYHGATITDSITVSGSLVGGSLRNVEDDT